MMKPRSSSQSAPSETGGRLRHSAIALLFILWMAVIVALFFLSHPLFPEAAISRWSGVLIDLGAAAWFLWVSVGLGWRWVQAPRLGVLERTALAGALGFGSLSLLALGLAALGWITGPAVAVLLAVLTLASLREGLRWAGEFRLAATEAGGESRTFDTVLAGFLALALLFSLTGALAPPVAWDALVYHLRIPQEIVAGRSLVLPGDSLFREMPHIAEMISAAALALTGRAETAAVVSWCLGLLALVGVTGTARRLGVRHPLLAPAVLLAGDTLARSMGWAYADWTAALFGYAVLCAISGAAAGSRWPLLAGVFAGLAFGAKYTDGLVLAAPLIWLVLAGRRKTLLRDLTLTAAGFLLAFLPWIVRDVVLWGNPLPPLLDASPAAVLRLRMFSGSPVANPLATALLLPFLQSTIGRYEAPPFMTTIGPLLLAFIPGAFFAGRAAADPDRFPPALAWLCAILYWIVAGVGVFFSSVLAQPRLWMALFPGLALLAAHGFDSLSGMEWRGVRLGRIAFALVVGTLALQAVRYAGEWTGSGVPAYLAGEGNATAYRDVNLGWYVAAVDAVNALPAGDRVLLLWEPRGFDCGSRCTEDATIDRWYLLMRLGRTPEEALAEWRAEGYTRVLVCDAGVEFEKANHPVYIPSDWAALDRLRAMLTVGQAFGSAYTLYSIPAAP